MPALGCRQLTGADRPDAMDDTDSQRFGKADLMQPRSKIGLEVGEVGLAGHAHPGGGRIQRTSVRSSAGCRALLRRYSPSVGDDLPLEAVLRRHRAVFGDALLRRLEREVALTRAGAHFSDVGQLSDVAEHLTGAAA